MCTVLPARKPGGSKSVHTVASGDGRARVVATGLQSRKPGGSKSVRRTAGGD